MGDNEKKSWEELITAYSLKNAIEHDGKAREGSVISALFHEGLKKEDVSKIIKKVKEIVKEINSLSLEKQEKEFENYEKIISRRKERKGLKPLPNVGEKIVLRLAPFPSGALHIGNAKTYLLNALYAEKYKGKLLLVIDDTIGSKEKRIVKEAYKLIPEAFDWLKVNYSKPIIYKSDRLKIYYRYAEKLIKLGKAYVCSCSQKKLQENRKKGVECSCRQFPPEEQLKRWKKMFKAKEGEYVLRIKTNMQHKNPAFRDRVLFRISEQEHPRVKKKYRVWPLLEFSWAIDDHLLGITHIIRGKDLMMETEMEKYIWDIFNWKHPEILHVGLVRIEGIEAKVSKSKAQKEVLSGELSGWDDPRTWSIQSLRRRGFLPETLRKFVEEIGLNENDTLVPIESLYALNRKFVDKIANRYSFIQEPVKMEIEGSFFPKEVKVKIHPEKKRAKKIKINKTIFISKKDYEKYVGKKVRLMHFSDVKLKKDKIEMLVKEKKSLPKLNWVSDFVNVKVLMPSGKWVFGIAEKTIRDLKPKSIVQFERFGFARFDRINDAGEYEFWFAHP